MNTTNKRSKSLVTSLRIAFSLFLLAGLLWWVSPSELLGVFKNVTVPLISYLILISVLLIYISVLKWKVLLRTQGRDESTVRLYGLYLMGYFFNLLFPSFVGGDAARSWYLGKNHGQREAAVATFLERYSGLFAMLSLSVIFMWFSPVITADVRITVLLIFVLFVGGSAFLLSQLAVQALSAIPMVGKKVAKQAMLFQGAVRLSSQSPRTVLFVFGYSFLFHCIAVVNVLACALAVGWLHVPVVELFVVLPVILLISALPITPQGIGVQEGAFVYYLTLLGAGSAEALGIALIIRAKAYLLALFGGAWWFIEGRRMPAQPIPEDLPLEA